MDLESNIANSGNSEEVSGNSEEVEQDTATQDTANEPKKQNPETENKADDESDDGTDDTATPTGEGETDDEDAQHFQLTDGEEVTAEKALEYAEAFKASRNAMKKVEMLMANSLSADGKDFENVEEFIDELINSADEALKQECDRQAGGDEALADYLFEKRKADREEKFNLYQQKKEETARQGQRNEVEKMADEFEKLQKFFPNEKNFTDLSDEVISKAKAENLSLLEAKLLVDLKKQSAKQSAEEYQNKGKTATSGSMSSTGKGNNPIISAMLTGFNR